MAEYLSRDDTYECLATAFGDRMAEDIIKLIPIADVQPVNRGHWIETDYGMFYECSECGNMESCETPYCAQCGARMDGDAE